MVLTAAQLTKIATSYAEAAQKICDLQDQGSELAWKANWFHILALIVADSGSLRRGSADHTDKPAYAGHST